MSTQILNAQDTAPTVDLLVIAPKGNSLWQDAFKRILKDRTAVICLVIFLVYVLVACLVGLGLLATNWSAEIGPSYSAPSSQSWRHWFGLDIFGRSVLLKTVYGAYVSITVGVLSSLLAVPLGVILGMLAGYFGGWVDDLITWFYTTLSNIPGILLITVLAYSLGKGIFSISIALAVGAWVGICRLIRGEVMKHKEREYLVAAKSLGASDTRRMFLHILPNVMHLVIINVSFQFVSAIKTEVFLSYIGLGVQGVPSWGTMIDEARQELARGIWWQLGCATMAMFFVVLALNVLGDALRDALDPKLK
jgi:ABC-type dipeptide/oligopeptide/nickel transport system permease subunit